MASRQFVPEQPRYFLSKVLEDILRSLSTQHKLKTAYRAQLTERVNHAEAEKGSTNRLRSRHIYEFPIPVDSRGVGAVKAFVWRSAKVPPLVLVTSRRNMLSGKQTVAASQQRSHFLRYVKPLGLLG